MFTEIFSHGWKNKKASPQVNLRRFFCSKADGRGGGSRQWATAGRSLHFASRTGRKMTQRLRVAAVCGSRRPAINLHLAVTKKSVGTERPDREKLLYYLNLTGSDVVTVHGINLDFTDTHTHSLNNTVVYCCNVGVG